MKKLCVCLLFTSLMTVLSGCSNNDDVIWDVYPAGISIRLEDADGNNLLSPETEGNWWGADFMVEYDGEAFYPNWGKAPESDDTRYYLPTFRGLTVTRAWWTDTEGSKMNYELYFGEFDGAVNAVIPIRFFVPGRNGFDTITLTHKCEWKGGEPKISNSINVNGKVSEGTEVVIVLPPRPAVSE